MNHTVRTTCLAILGIVTLLGAGGDDVRERVANGIRKYRDSDFNGAAKEFADADLLAPDNPFIQFNRGCAESHDEENRDGARDFFRSAAMAKNTSVAAAAHYNLGCLESREARGLFDGYAEGLAGKDREKAVAALNKSIDHFRDCLRIEPDHTRSKRNIEIIKLFLADVRRKWDEQDRRKKPPEQQPQEESLVRFLDRLDAAQQRALQLTAEGVENPVDVTAEACQSMQVRVNNQIPELREKLDAEFRKDTDDKQQKESLARVAELFRQQTDEFQVHAEGALKELAGANLEAAKPEQRLALERLNKMYEMLAKFPDLVFRSLRIQRSAYQSTRLNANTERFNPGSRFLTPTAQLAERQGRVASMAKLLPSRAAQFEQVLGQVEQQAGQGLQQPGGMDPQTLAGYRTAIERLTELGPELVDVTDAAEKLLRSEELQPTLPKQERALEILAQIAETLPKPPQDNQNGQDNDEDQQGDEEKNDKPTADEDRGETDPQQQPQQQEQRRRREEQIRSREQAEAMLRKVHDRKQAHRDKKARLRAMARRAHVERDW